VHKYTLLTLNLRDSIYNADKTRSVQRTELEQEIKTREIENKKKQYENEVKMYALISGFAIVLLIAFFLYRNNRHKQRANTLLQQQKVKVETTLSELKKAQSQLIQSEKMASLGELTAGIAHEIQNPLNFVNNFAEVNGELIKELKREASTGNMEEVTTIADDIEANSEKINHHGKRADAIVKGMLQHSRTGSGQKELTDVNRIADEYLRLAYQSFRAKDKSFNATIVTEFNDNIGDVNIIPQEIGMVILNLINNAFYAVSEKQRQNVSGYEPAVAVSTSKLNDKVEIKVKDNGNGIPGSIKEKIFQPFFTTKPTGQGTGLGLSLAYDIVKAHGGEINVETKEGEGSVFSIVL
jgi:two-component system, NtrC family, sensor kinase